MSYPKSDKLMFRPQINKMSKTIERALPLLDYFENWIRERDSGIERKRNDTGPAITPPSINQRSSKLADRWRSRDHSPTPPSEEFPFRPSINATSSSLKRETPLPERMAQVAEEKRNKLEEARKQRLLEEEESLKHTISSGTSLLSQIRGTPIEEDLYQREREAQERRLRTLASQMEQEDSLYTPKINDRSRFIATKLQGNPKRSSPPSVSILDPQQDPDLTFSPRINRHSAELAANSKPVSTPRSHYLYSKRGEVSKTRDSLAISSVERETAGCTFSPRITRKAKDSNGTFKTEGSVVSRTLAWKQRKEQKMLHEKEKLIEEQLKECTFTPNQQRRKQRGPGVRPNSEASLKKYYGVDEFLTRQQKARKIREEQDPERLISRGDNWNPEVTKPEPFKFVHSKEKLREDIANSPKRVNQDDVFVPFDDVDPNQDANMEEWKLRRREKVDSDNILYDKVEKPWRSSDSPRVDLTRKRCSCCNGEECTNEPSFIDFSDVTGRHAGELEFYKRLQLSRTRPEEPKESWSPKLTKPHEFRFNQRPMEGKYWIIG
ncbi:hypothetical protein GEMRC1_002387 [Eukaryota sp. GEM-RC1]